MFDCLTFCVVMLIAWQLGDGTIVDKNAVPSSSLLAGTVLSVCAGEFHTCVLTTAGGVRCWGGNSNGQVCYALMLYGLMA